MKFVKNRWRRFSNTAGIFFTFISVSLLLASFVTVSSSSSSAFPLFISSLFLNYFITAFVGLELIGSSNKSDAFITSYLCIFLLVPYLGTLVYFLFGFDSIYTSDVDNYSIICEQYNKYKTFNKPKPKYNCRTFSYNEIKYKSEIYPDTKLLILDTPLTILEEMVNLIKNAKYFINLEFYLFCDGLIFEYFLELFKEKINQGVKINLIVDYFGNMRRLKRSSIKRLIEIGVQFRYFNPLFRKNKMWWQFRNHNKVLIVDNEHAILGSCNIADEYFNVNQGCFQTTELSAKFSGSIVKSFAIAFLVHWELCKENKHQKSTCPLKEQDLYFRNSDSNVDFEDDKCIAQFLDHSPLRNETVIKDNLVQLIFNAKKRIIISTPYFYPPKELINALKHASISGVSVKILVPKNPDLVNFFSTLNRQSFFTLIKQDIEIYEYFGFNHEKVIIVDDEIVYFGSYNWDYRTLCLNFENAVLVESEKINQIMSSFMDKQFKNSHRILEFDLKMKSHKFFVFFSKFIHILKPFL